MKTLGLLVALIIAILITWEIVDPYYSGIAIYGLVMAVGWDWFHD